MYAFFDEVPTSTSLLMQCGYRSKVCTNHRATKLDGTLHKLCEFHRRKANANQQRLHKRQREKRARVQLREQDEECEPSKERPPKKSRVSAEPIVLPAAAIDCYKYEFAATSEGYQYYAPLGASDFAFPKLGSTDMDILGLLLLDMQPQTLPPLETFLPNASTSIDDKGSIVV
ncbi:hypothetical protein PRIC2_003085 [Phytophthora ramorum]